MSYLMLQHGRFAVLVLIGAVPVVARAQIDPPNSPNDARVALHQLDAFHSEIRKLGDWSSQADMIDQFIDKVWDRNGWNSESDGFARQLNHEVARIPPWQLKQRLDTLTDMVSERYEFSAMQRIRFQAKVFSESIGFIARNAGVISRQLREYVGRQIRKQPISPRDVQRWTRQSEPMMEDMEGRLDRIFDSMKRDMNPQQRNLLDRDLESFESQMEFLRQQRASWARGEWKPEDWGLENDPLLLRQRQEGASKTPSNAATRQPGIEKSKPHERAHKIDIVKPYRPEDESSWGRYVREFVKRYQLDAGQRDAIYSILAELEARAAKYRLLHADELQGAAASQAPAEDALSPIRAMFEELKARAHGLLTKPQRTVDKKKIGPS